MILVNLSTLISKLNAYSRSALESATEMCAKNQNKEILPSHFLYELAQKKGGDIDLILEYFNIDPEEFINLLRIEIEKIPRKNIKRPIFSISMYDILQDAWVYTSVQYQSTKMRSGYIFLPYIVKLKNIHTLRLQSLLEDIDRTELIEKFASITSKSFEYNKSEKDAGGLGGDAAAAGEEEHIAQFCVDMTKEAAAGKLFPVHGRDREIAQAIRILLKTKKSNPVLVGEPGVGKTAIVEALAAEIAQGNVPTALKGARLLALDLTLLEAGASVKGQFEDRITKLIKAVKESKDTIILFIDEAHRIVKKGGDGSADIANILKPELARGEIKVIAATTWDEYKKYFEKDSALERRFTPVKVNELETNATLTILRKMKSSFKEKYDVEITDEGLKTAIKLTNKYVWDRRQPDKSLDLIDSCSASALTNLERLPPKVQELNSNLEELRVEKNSLLLDSKFDGTEEIDQHIEEISNEIVEIEKERDTLKSKWSGELDIVKKIKKLKEEYGTTEDETIHADIKKMIKAKQGELAQARTESQMVRHKVDSNLVAAILAHRLRLPVEFVTRTDTAAISDLYESLSKKIKGQNCAIDIISRQLSGSYMGLTSEKKPMGVFLLVGPSGVGKTETAHQLAEHFFANQDNVISLNMTEFSEKHTVSRLVGSPPGYVGYGEGGLLTEAVRKHPNSIVLLDEIDKACEPVLDVFYQVFDKGQLTDGEGKIVNFHNTVFILTSNRGSLCLTKPLEDSNEDFDHYVKEVYDELAQNYKKSFLNRVTITPYFPLSDDSIRRIAEDKINALMNRLNKKYESIFNVSEEVIDRFAAYGVKSGAREIDHRLTQEITSTLLAYFLREEVDPEVKREYNIGVKDNEIVIESTRDL